MQYLRSVWLFLGLLLAFSTLLSAQSEFKYSYMPKKVYENQLFAVTVIAVGESGSKKPNFTFDSASKTQPLFKRPLLVQNGPDSFYTFYFKASDVDIRIPRLFISTDSGESSLEPKTVFIKTLKQREDFCQVLAADMKIKNSQVSNYDEKNHIVTLSIEAFEANLEDIALSNVQEAGLDALDRRHAKVDAEFYVVLPVEQKQLKFTYFNTIKKQYVFLEVPVVVADASVTTQSDLNPKDDSFEKLKKYTFMFLVGFFFIMFLFRRDFFYETGCITLYLTYKHQYDQYKDRSEDRDDDIRRT